MSDLTISQLIKIILGIIVVVVVIIALYFFFKNQVINFFSGFSNLSKIFLALVGK